MSSHPVQHPPAMDGDMDDNPTASTDGADISDTESTENPMPAIDLPARYQFFYNDICRFCDDMWANITSVRSRAVEHVIFSASILGLHLTFDAASQYYEIGWWSFSAILILIAATLPHLRLAVGFTEVDERRLDIDHMHEPPGKPENSIIAALEKKAEALNEKSAQSGRQYIFARAVWFMGTVSTAALSVIEWFA